MNADRKGRSMLAEYGLFPGSPDTAREVDGPDSAEDSPSASAARALNFLVDRAAKLCGMPFSVVNIITPEQQVQLAAAGLEPVLCGREELAEFTGRVSHDLRIPLTTILGYVELSEDDAGILPDSPAAGYLQLEPLVRMHRPGDAPGSGLGLATCVRIVKSHGGDLPITETPGGGTTVSAFFPNGGRDDAA
jgi:signal transduction histidine kinase